MSDRRALVIGEALVDVIDGVPRPGGSPANVAVGLARAGCPVTLATQLGDDAYGALLRAHLSSAGVEVLACAGARTSSAVATIGAGSAATYVFDIVWEPSWPTLPAAAITHVGSFSALAVQPPPGVLSYDLNVRPALLPEDARGRMLALVERATIVKGSDEDLAWLVPGRSWEDAAADLLRRGPQVVWVTRGPAGAAAFTADGRIDVPAPHVEVVDTIGAGDAFSAGLVAGWLRWGEDWARVGGLAVSMAAEAVRRRGA